MNAMKVAITDYEYETISAERAVLEAAGIECRDFQCKTEEDVIRQAAGCDGLIVQYAPITARVIAALERCRVIVRYGIGVDNVDVAAATAKGIFVCNVPDYGVEDVANHAFAFLLALAKKIPQQQAQMHSGGWGYAEIKPITRLSCCTLGLLGFGRIPQQVCIRAKAFGMKVIAHDPYLDPEKIRAAGAGPVDFDTLLAQSDFLSCHCPLTPSTRHWIDRRALAKMKKSACLINTSRGGLICEADLIDALRSGVIAGAGLDVFETEPLPKDSPLRGMPQLLLTGHAAWYSEEARSSLQRMAAEEAARVLTGNPPRSPVNRELLG